MRNAAPSIRRHARPVSGEALYQGWLATASSKAARRGTRPNASLSQTVPRVTAKGKFRPVSESRMMLDEWNSRGTRFVAETYDPTRSISLQDTGADEAWAKRPKIFAAV